MRGVSPIQDLRANSWEQLCTVTWVGLSILGTGDFRLYSPGNGNDDTRAWQNGFWVSVRLVKSKLTGQCVRLYITGTGSVGDSTDLNLPKNNACLSCCAFNRLASVM